MSTTAFEFPIFGRVDLDGTHRAIIETTAEEFAFPEGDNLFLEINWQSKRCCCSVNAIKVGAPQNRILVDRYKLWCLGAKDEAVVNAGFCTPQVAKRIEYSASTPFSGRDTVRLIGKSFTAGEKSALFTFSGEARPYTVVSTDPGEMVLVTPATELVEAGDTEESYPLSYSDIGGLDNEIRLIREHIEYPFKYRDVFAHLGVSAPKGLILHGPPGTGKTLIAKALANEVGAHYTTISGPEIYSKWYGSSEQTLRNIFNEAVKNAPSIVLIDELDSLVPRRDKIHGDQEQRIVATFLTQMDGLKSTKDVVVVGTTNRVNEIDPALRRSGRFEQEIYVGVPDHGGRKDILEIHTKRMPLSDDIDLGRVAELANGFTGADITALCREAAYSALRRTLPEEAFQTGSVDDHRDVSINQADFLGALQAVRPSAAKEYSLDVPSVEWAQIGGLEHIKQILIENLETAVQHKEAFDQVGIKAAGGILLYGPPGTGKTLLARAVASSCNLNFIGVKGSDIRDKWVGESEDKIKNVFQKARLLTPCVIFFDEIDTLLKTRGQDKSGISDAIVNQVLSEMDGLEDFGKIFVMGATNRIHDVDEAVLRPGRFDYHLEVPLPDAKGRKEIFKIHMADKPCAAMDYDGLAALTDGFSGAQIAETCRVAAWLSLRECNYDAETVCISMAHLEAMIARIETEMGR